MLKIVPVFALVALLSACSSTPRGGEPPPPRYQHTVKFESDPEGMRVYFGEGGEVPLAEKARSFVGITPCETKVKCDSAGLFNISGIKLYNSFRPAVAVFEAEPPAADTNLFKQQVTYDGDAHFKHADKVPDAVFFDMHKH